MKLGFILERRMEEGPGDNGPASILSKFQDGIKIKKGLVPVPWVDFFLMLTVIIKTEYD